MNVDRRRTTERNAAPLKPVHRIGAPVERIALDILAPLPVTLQGSEYILVLSDYFSEMDGVFFFSNQEAITVADKQVNEFISRFGVPQQLHSDQGTNFEPNVMAEICAQIIAQHREDPNDAVSPQSNGHVERFNRTLVEMLKGKISENQTDCDIQLWSCLIAYRSSVHESTGETPNQHYAATKN